MIVCRLACKHCHVPRHQRLRQIAEDEAGFLFTFECSGCANRNTLDDTALSAECLEAIAEADSNGEADWIMKDYRGW